MRSIGNLGEKRARDYLLSCGLEILDSNFYSRFGEIDIIAKSKEGIHFVEVKSTKHSD
ncbi:MAG: YraN family protein, partial [Campylobacteraceae bacterium]|nr:YraN family protein [Campylobacteraceae bacterium]